MYDLERVFASLGEGVVAVDRAGIVVHANSAAAELLEMDPSRSVGQHLYVAVASRDVCEALEQVMRGSDVDQHTCEVTLPGAAGDVVAMVRVTPLRDDGGDGSIGYGAIAVVQDITDVRRAERARADFFTNVSHELKTPVTAIRGIVETLLDDVDMDPGVRADFLGRCASQTDRLGTLVTDLIALARLESEVDTLQRAPVDLSALVAEVVSEARPRADRARVTITEDIASGARMVGDEESLRQAVSNLVVNAITYTDAGGSATVCVHRDVSDMVVLEITDTGLGIPAHMLDRIFERFYRVDPARSRARGGSGIGLSIVKHVAIVHGGDVSVQSELGVGSCFRMSFPAVPGELR